jgi:uncharacterized protein YbaR (Trm112 family)
MMPKMGFIPTHIGLVHAEFDKEKNRFFCPACKNPPDLALLTSDERAWLICRSKGCPYRTLPNEYRKLYSKALDVLNGRSFTGPCEHA